MHTDTQTPHPNRLIHAQSPYLLQHAYNPVDWREWNDETLHAAHTLNRPILLSVGYSACHWCHVMEHESFADVTVASIMNEHFVCIKVDREERPDIDAIYMTALQRLTGQGGWPMTMFLTPDGQPFYGGTYYPPEDRGRMPGFQRVLRSVATAWHDREQELRQASQELQSEITLMMSTLPAGELPNAGLLEHAYQQLTVEFDSVNGGYGSAPKFPPAMLLEALLRASTRTASTEHFTSITTTLDRMAAGGIFDQLAGGFHRYSVDAEWMVPHFEKMLYDNGLLLRAYSLGYQHIPKPRYAEVVAHTCAWLLREMRHPEGGLYSALDADSEGEEGRFYAWSAEEFTDIVGNEASLCREWFGIDQPLPHFESGYVLQQPHDLEGFAARVGRSPADVSTTIQAATARLSDARAQRIRPQCDDKIIASWNGLAITGLVQAGRTFAEPAWIDAAEQALQFIERHLWHEHVLYRTWRQGVRSQTVGFLEDYANMAEAALAVGMATGKARWLHWAQALANQMVRHFYVDTPEGGFFDTSDLHATLIVRPREHVDNATPSGASTSIEVLLCLADLFYEPYYAQIAETALQQRMPLVSRWPQGFGKLLTACERYVAEPVEIVHAGPRGPLWDYVIQHAPPHAVLVCADALPDITLCRDKVSLNGLETVYYCRNHVCHTPVTDVASVMAIQNAH